MSFLSLHNRRNAYRLQVYLPAAFSLNGGPATNGHIIDLAHRSVALHGPACARAGDAAEVRIDALPPLKGRVVRSFKGGFAVRLERISLALIAYAKTRPQNLNAAPLAYSVNRLISAPFNVDAEFPAWARIASSCRNVGRSERHYLSVVYIRGPSVEELASACIISGEMCWRARLSLARRRGEETVAVFILNGWQLQNAVAEGLAVAFPGAGGAGPACKAGEDAVRIMRMPVNALGEHLMSFQPRKMHNQLLSKRPATADSLSTMDGSRDSGGVITA